MISFWWRCICAHQMSNMTGKQSIKNFMNFKNKNTFLDFLHRFGNEAFVEELFFSMLKNKSIINWKNNNQAVRQASKMKYSQLLSLLILVQSLNRTPYDSIFAILPTKKTRERKIEKKRQRQRQRSSVCVVYSLVL